MIGGVSDDPATGAVRRTGDADVAESDCSAREIEVHLFGITARFVLMGRFLPESAESPANVTPRRTFKARHSVALATVHTSRGLTTYNPGV